MTITLTHTNWSVSLYPAFVSHASFVEFPALPYNIFVAAPPFYPVPDLCLVGSVVAAVVVLVVVKYS